MDKFKISSWFRSSNIISKFQIVVFVLFCSIANAQPTLISEMDNLEWEKLMPGIWKASFGELGLNALDYVNPPSQKEL